MPRTPQENERIRQAARTNILNAAMDLFMKKGYHATTIQDVAKAAGISKGLAYNYFQGKEELLAAVVQARIQEVEQVMQTALSIESPKEQLKFIMDSAIDSVYEQPAMYRFYLHLQTQPEADEVLVPYSAELIREHARLFELQCAIFERMGVPRPRIRSLYFSSVLQGTMLMVSTYPERFPFEEVKAQIAKEFCE